MIGKQIKGRGFRGLLDYLQSSQESRLIGGNMSGRNALELAREFKVSRQLNPEVERAVYHVSLSAAKDDQLDDYQWCEIADKYMERMGFDCNQYTIFRHANTDDDHIHIVASRIRLDTGKVVHDSWDYVRSEKVLRELEKEYELVQVAGSRDKLARTPTTGQVRRIKREQSEYERGERESPPQRTIKQRLQELIDHATADQPTMPQFIERLQQHGVEVRHGLTRNGKSKGISYAIDEQHFSGTHLGAAYTFPGLQKHKNVDYQPLRDDALMLQLLSNPVKQIQNYQQSLSHNHTNADSEEEEIQFEHTQTVAPILTSLLKSVDSNRFEGKQHTAYWDDNQLVLMRNNDGVQLMRASYNSKRSQWEPVERSQLTTEEVQHFQQLIPKIQSRLHSLQQEKERSLKNRSRGLSR